MGKEPTDTQSRRTHGRRCELGWGVGAGGRRGDGVGWKRDLRQAATASARLGKLSSNGQQPTPAGKHFGGYTVRASEAACVSGLVVE